MHGIELIKRLEIGVDAFNILPRWRYEHTQCAGQLNATGCEELQHVVETG